MSLVAVFFFAIDDINEMNLKINLTIDFPLL